MFNPSGESEMKQISQVTFDFLKDQFERAVYDFAQDPDEVCTSPTDAIAYYEVLQEVAKECGMDFWNTVTKEQDGERLRSYLRFGGMEI